MSKNKSKAETPNPTNIANRDILQRLNFLYQASVFLNGLAPPSSIPRDDNPSRSSTTIHDKHKDTPSRRSRSKGKMGRRVVSFGELSRSYVDTMKSVGQKTNVRIDPSVKRRICKRCSVPLIPGVSATVRIQESASHGHLITYRCHCCQTERRIPAPPILRVDSQSDDDVSMKAQSTETTNSSVAAASASTVESVRRGRKKGPKPRLPPHFARDVGHVVFRGNERLDAASVS